MQPISFQDQIKERLQSGESLIPVSQIKALKSIPATTRNQWCKTGRIPVVQIATKYHAIESLVIKALAEMTVQGKTKSPFQSRNANIDMERVKALSAKTTK